MFSKSGTDLLRTTTFRLTLWYLGVFSALLLVVFGLVYFFLTTHLHDQIDHEIMNTAREFGALYNEQGVKALQAEFMREAASQGTGRVFFELFSPEGRLLASSNPDPEVKTLDSDTIRSGQKDSFYTQSLPDGKHKIRVGSIFQSGGNLLRIGTSLEGDEVLLERYRETFGTALVIMLVCGGFVGWLLARKAMAGVKRVTETARQIGRRDFGRRVVLGDEGEEIHALGQAFNGMLERTESLFNELQRITDHIAHELRTPITRIRGTAETTLQHGKTLDDFREMAASVIAGSDDLIEIIGTMLEIAKTNSGAAKLEQVPIQLSEILSEAIDLFAPLAEEKQIAIQFADESGGFAISGNRSKLQRVVANLLDNAIKYTPDGGSISLVLKPESNHLIFDLSNTGTGIPEKDLPHIFDRFYRADPGRSAPGSGLGLALARAIIRAHGGRITVTSSAAGTSFRVSLPAKPPAFTER